MKNNIHLLPEFPHTLHLPFHPNASKDDFIAAEVDVIFKESLVYVEEKVDGSSIGISMIDGHPVIRNRSHILKKGLVKDTPAKKQFASAWGWFYDNQNKFEKIKEFLGNITIYGEWMLAQHGLFYDKLPSWLIAYDIFSHEERKFLDPSVSRKYLKESGFYIPILIHFGKIESYQQVEEWTRQDSEFTTQGLREGVYIKISDGKTITHRFKMVRQGFVQGALWHEKKLRKNKLMRFHHDESSSKINAITQK
jgi:hypothetical protein